MHWEYVGELGDYYTKAQVDATMSAVNANVAYYRQETEAYSKKADEYFAATDDKITEMGKTIEVAKDAYFASVPTFVETSSETEESDAMAVLSGLFAETSSTTTISE